MKEISEIFTYPQGFSLVYSKGGEIKEKYQTDKQVNHGKSDNSKNITQINFMFNLNNENLKDAISFSTKSTAIKQNILENFVKKFIKSFEWNSSSTKIIDFFRK